MRVRVRQSADASFQRSAPCVEDDSHSQERSQQAGVLPFVGYLPRPAEDRPALRDRLSRI